jgi:hypothetical protein
MEPNPDAASAALVLVVAFVAGYVLSRGIRVVHRFELDPETGWQLDSMSRRAAGAADALADSIGRVADRPSFLRLFGAGTRPRPLCPHCGIPAP